MKLSLVKEQGPCPPDGFRYVFPEDGFVCHAWTYNDWVALAKAHLQANNSVPPEDLEAQMQDQLCKTLPPGWCLYDQDDRPRATVLLDWGTVATALSTFAGWISSGCKFVSQAEADRRADICSKCYLNVNISGCAACQKLIGETIGERRTKFDASLRGCAVCKCTLRAMVHFRLDDLKKTAHQKELYLQVPHCWLNPESGNYRG